jgi:RimJ/RimL family protein N-acetyltransferase
MKIRQFELADEEALRAFSRRLPEEDRNFFKEDVEDPGVVERWRSDGRTRRLVARENGDIIGYAGVVPLSGWSHHVAELREVVASDRRRRGVGRALAQAALRQAWEMECTKIIVEVVSEQDATIAMFQMLGFEPEALLREHVRDRDGALRDLLVLAHHVDDNMQAWEAVGLPETLAQ